MSFRATALKRSLQIVSFLGLTTFPTLAQVANAPVKFVDNQAITATLVDAPVVSGSPSTSVDAQWLKVEFHFIVTKDAGPFLDAVDFKVWIEGLDLYDPQGKPGEGIAVALTGSVTYVNIAAPNNDVYGVFYVHPSSLTRYCKTSPSDFERDFNIHMEASVGGKVVDFYDKKKEQDPDWYKPLKPVTGLVYRQNQAPFIVVDPNRYPAVKLPADSNN